MRKGKEGTTDSRKLQTMTFPSKGMLTRRCHVRYLDAIRSTVHLAPSCRFTTTWSYNQAVLLYRTRFTSHRQPFVSQNIRN